MLTTFTIGVVVGIIIVIILLKLTMTTEPGGCLLAAGLVIFLLSWIVILSLTYLL